MLAKSPVGAAPLLDFDAYGLSGSPPALSKHRQALKFKRQAASELRLGPVFRLASGALGFVRSKLPVANNVKRLSTAARDRAHVLKHLTAALRTRVQRGMAGIRDLAVAERTFAIAAEEIFDNRTTSRATMGRSLAVASHARER